MRNKGAERGTWATFSQAARENAGLSKAALAREVGVDRATITRWEADVNTPTTGAIVANFARATGVPEDEALRAAGVLSSDDPPTTPSGDDIELRVIRESRAPERVKKALIEYVHRRRTEQARERMDAIELALKNQQD